MFMSLTLAVACFASGTISLSIFSQCKINDMACIEKSINVAAPKILAGDPELGVRPSDPLSIEKIEGNLSIIKYTFYNTTHTGFKKCLVSNLKLDEDITSLHFDLICPKISMNGQYEITGRLIILPVEGSGDYLLYTGKYILHVDSELKKNRGEDGKTHISIKNFKLKGTPLEPITFVFRNLFNGQKDLSDAVHKFANDNWKEVADLVQDPIWYACMKKMISNVNKYMKHVALEDIVLE